MRPTRSSGGATDEGNWRAILDYFAPAVPLGLTATPKRTLNADTYAYFGEPVFVYSLKEGINDGFLTPFKVKQIATTLDEYVYTPDDLVVEGEIEAGKRYEEKDFNKIIEIKDRETYRVKLLMDMIDQREKTIVFCATQAHALAVRDLINQAKTLDSRGRDPNYCVRVTANDGALGDQALREFQDNDKTIPTVLTTSQKLSTGVDARNVRNIVLMRPINSMIEFKQIIGRGTRLYDGKDCFTIYDFVKAHHHFNDPEWDGEPIEPEPRPLRTGDGATDVPAGEPSPPPLVDPPPARIKVKLADGKERRIQHMTATSFWSADGRPMSAAQCLEPLAEMQKLIEAENSDLFDVLGYVAFAAEPVTRAERAAAAKAATAAEVTDKQQAFVDFVLAQYVRQGVDELDAEKLAPRLKLKYQNTLADALSELGKPDQVRSVFLGFQRHLYERRARG